jgi:hypothetical protein
MPQELIVSSDASTCLPNYVVKYSSLAAAPYYSLLRVGGGVRKQRRGGRFALVLRSNPPLTNYYDAMNQNHWASTVVIA